MEHIDPKLDASPGVARTGPGARVLGAETDNARAYTSLKQAVLSGGFKPGEVVTLRALAKRLAVGDTAVREAVKRLISEGAFEGLPNRSARVPLLDRREIQQILDLRILLESNAAALAAHNITLHQIEQLREMHKAMGTPVGVATSTAYPKHNTSPPSQHYPISASNTPSTLTHPPSPPPPHFPPPPPSLL